MAKARATSKPPSLTKSQAIQLRSIQRNKAQSLSDNPPISSDDEDAWKTVTHDVLAKSFGDDSPNISDIIDIGLYDFPFADASQAQRERQRSVNMRSRLTILDGLIEMLQAELNLNDSEPSVPSISPPGNKVFLVHGHNERAIHETARFLEQLGLVVTILREQPNSGRTIIEKFVDYANVGFAVVLLTGDDRGGTADCAHEAQKLRARQNVILELGFFLGKLGRLKVCALCQPGVEIPSDYSGVLFVPIDANGAWKMALAKEMKAAGFQIDMNKAV